MSTPSFVKFSRVPGAPHEAYLKLEKDVFTPMNIKMTRAAEMEWAEDQSYTWFDGGMPIKGEIFDCTSATELIELSKNWAMFSSAHLVPYIPADIHFTVFDVNTSEFSFTMDVDFGAVSYGNDDLEEGAWMKSFLTAMTATLRAEICGFGRGGEELEPIHESLNPRQIVEKLRNGDLLEVGFPVYYAISADLISAKEARRAYSDRDVSDNSGAQFLSYEFSTLGYHIFYTIP